MTDRPSPSCSATPTSPQSGKDRTAANTVTTFSGAIFSSPTAGIPIATASTRHYVPPPGTLDRHMPSKRKGGRAAAINVAKYLVYLASYEAEPDYLSHLRLQKILYYVQGWSLALRNKPMFNERIEAWAHGPVVRDVYSILASFGDRPILLGNLGLPENLTQEEMGFIQNVWDSYKKFSASSLREMSHKESPWLEARKDCGPADRCENEITQDAMKIFFTKIAG
jgi:uncharacterized phage-associated protein